MGIEGIKGTEHEHAVQKYKILVFKNLFLLVEFNILFQKPVFFLLYES